MLHIVSTIVVLLIAAGLYYRRRAAVHLRYMTAAFLLDLSLVIYIEATRHAVEQVATGVRPLVYFHAGVSLATMVLYVIQIVLGRQLLAARTAAATDAATIAPVDAARTRHVHRLLGITFCVVRGLNYVTSFML
jgi:hypothetical protein